MINVSYLSSPLILEFYDQAIAVAATGGKLSGYRLVLSNAIAPSTIADVLAREIEPFPSLPITPYVLADGNIQCCVEPLKDLVFASFALIKESSNEGLFLCSGEHYQTVQHSTKWLLNFPRRLEYFRRNHSA